MVTAQQLACNYDRIVTVEESLTQNKADVDAIMQCEPKLKLFELVRQRKMASVSSSIREISKSFYRELREFYESEKLSEKP